MIFKHLRWIAIHLTFSFFWVPAHAQSTNLSFKTSIEKELNVLKEQPNSKIDILVTCRKHLAIVMQKSLI